MPGELPGESTLLVAAVTATPMLPVPEIMPDVKVIGLFRAVAELYLKCPPLIVIPLVLLIEPAEAISSKPPVIDVAPE